MQQGARQEQFLSFTKPCDNFLSRVQDYKKNTTIAVFIFQHKKYHISISLHYTLVLSCTVMSCHVLYCLVFTVL